MQATKALEAALDAKATISEAFSAALAAADQALTLVDFHEARITALEGELTGAKAELTDANTELKHMKSLAILCDPIGLFRDIIAARLGHIGWDAMSAVMKRE